MINSTQLNYMQSKRSIVKINAIRKTTEQNWNNLELNFLIFLLTKIGLV